MTVTRYPDAGIHEMPADEYHGDPAAGPSLSSSIAHLLCSSSPAHARAAHPKLNPAFKRQQEHHFDIGSAAHRLLLEPTGADIVTVIDAKDWTTKLAREQRDEAYSAGRIPLLAHQLDSVEAMVAAVREQLEAKDVTPVPFTDGKAEQTLIWQDGGVACRARPDWLRDDKAAIDDFKTAGRSADPAKFSRTLFDNGYDVQAAFYLRGLRILTGAEAEFRFVVVETVPPFALSVVSLNPAALALANDKVEYALRAWKRGVTSGVWPAYPSRVCYAEVPTWHEIAWLEKDGRETS